MKIREILKTGQSVIDVKLTHDIQRLKEVVDIGYGKRGRWEVIIKGSTVFMTR